MKKSTNKHKSSFSELTKPEGVILGNLHRTIDVYLEAFEGKNIFPQFNKDFGPFMLTIYVHQRKVFAVWSIPPPNDKKNITILALSTCTLKARKRSYQLWKSLTKKDTEHLANLHEQVDEWSSSFKNLKIAD